MKRLRLAVSVLWLILCFGCSASHTGKYVDPRIPSNYLELKSDGSFFARESGGEFYGTYEIKGGSITLKLPMGLAVTEKINGDTIINNDGSTWVKQ